MLFLSNDKMFANVMTLEQSFRDVHSTRPRAVMVTEAVSQFVRSKLKAMNMELIDIKQRTHEAFKPKYAEWNTTLSKLDVRSVRCSCSFRSR